MTARIPLTALKGLPFDFEQAVKDFVQAKKDHLLTEGVPAPAAPHHMVEAAVRRIPGSVTFVKGVPVPGSQQMDDFVADYQIVDDTPPAPTLEERKSVVAAKINSEATGLRNQINPPLKVKLLSIQYHEALDAELAGKATTSDHEVLQAWEDRQQKLKAIDRHVAKLESQLHDLPADMVDLWKWAPFPFHVIANN